MKDWIKELAGIAIVSIATSLATYQITIYSTDKTVAATLKATADSIQASKDSLKETLKVAKEDNVVDDKREDDKFKSELITRHYKNMILVLTDEKNIKGQDILDAKVSKYVLETYLDKPLLEKMVQTANDMNFETLKKRHKTGFRWPANTSTFVDAVGSPVEGLRVEAISGLMFKSDGNKGEVSFSEERLEDAIRKAAAFQNIKEEIESTRAITTSDGLKIEYRTPASENWLTLSNFPLTDVTDVKTLRNFLPQLSEGVGLTGKTSSKAIKIPSE